MESKDIISDAIIEKVWGYADFGERLNNNKRNVVDNALLKVACGYSNGHTAQQIITDLGLVDEKSRITKIGMIYLWESFHVEDL